MFSKIKHTIITYHFGGIENYQRIGRYFTWRQYYIGRLYRAWRNRAPLCLFSYAVNKKYKNRERQAGRIQKYGSSTLLTNQDKKKKKKEELYREQGGRCTWCGEQSPIDNLTVDHIVRVSDGGTGDIENLQLLHRHCHDKKEKEYDRKLAKKTKVTLNQHALDRIEWDKLAKCNEKNGRNTVNRA